MHAVLIWKTFYLFLYFINLYVIRNFSFLCTLKNIFKKLKILFFTLRKFLRHRITIFLKCGLTVEYRMFWTGYKSTQNRSLRKFCSAEQSQNLYLPSLFLDKHKTKNKTFFSSIIFLNIIKILSSIIFYF